jgi:hypothetical protein
MFLFAVRIDRNGEMGCGDVRPTPNGGGACRCGRYRGWRQAMHMQTGKTQMAIVRRGIADRLFPIVFNNIGGAAHQCHLAPVFAVAMRGVSA